MYAYANDSFYPLSMRSIYEAAGSWPESYIEVNVSVFAEFSVTPPVGKIRAVGADGRPCWVDVPPASSSELIAIADAEKQRLRQLAEVAMSPLVDAVDFNDATDEEVERLKQWKKYRIAVNRVDTGTAPNIEWPTQP